ncbi:DUF1028 domain-containing protein [Phaeobacter sp. 22II1-1F12B]|uniref:DUF1028 domain-containing protein n=1 Tax=Phaeobacter sp. 22II1-1F12B TaxID=1317111 RepID=UPI000B52129E|nr:DUF1028 domain-containing protein [Phaeobacter sp. 22II1-1F12B]OWU82383.1 major pilin protein fimA [Phaeobacter sp. 22II1-1F12B]
MTISILAFDEKTGSYGGAATTGSLCVGGWVLRGDAESGMSASQGSLPSTLWGTGALDLMKEGLTAPQTVAKLTGEDSGRDHRQMSALDLNGNTAAFTGQESIAFAGSREAPHVVVAGNLLSSASVLDSCLVAFTESEASFELRLIEALEAAASTGGDSRGLLSAAILIVNRDAAPLTLRIDYSEHPLRDLRALYRRATTTPYSDWADLVPTLNDPHRATAPSGAIDLRKSPVK